MLQMLYKTRKDLNFKLNNAKRILISVSKVEDGLENFGYLGSITTGREQQVEKFKNFEG